MRTLTFISALFLSLFFVACSGDVKKDYSASFEVHKEAMALETEAAKILEDYQTNFGDLINENSILGQMAPEKMTQLNSRLSSVQARLKDWQSNVIEVPGMEHKHDGETCNHTHAPAIDISPDEMLAAQQSMNKEISDINRDVKTLFELTMKAMENGFNEGEVAPQ